MESKEPMVSIICITYNQVEYIEDAIKSFLLQETNFDFEVIIHDDASDDGTAEIVKSYAEKYPDKIKAILQKENQYSKGIKFGQLYILPLLRGKYTALCEGDDFWTDKHKLQKQFDYMESHPDCAMYLHNGWNISKDKKYMHNSEPLTKEPHIFGVEDAIKGLGIKVVTNSFFYRTEIRKDEPPFMKIAPTGDYGRVIVAALHGYIYYNPETMSAHRAAAKNSLTERWAQNPSLWKNYLEKELIMFEQMDRDTDYHYTEIIKQEKINREFGVYLQIRDKNKLNEEPFKSMVKNMPLKKKIKYFHPKLFAFIQKIVVLFRKKDIKKATEIFNS